MKKLLLLLLLLGVMPATAQESVRFHVESIDVRQLRHAKRDIILSEARLHEGGRYTESDLHDAADRIERLPFVLDAQFSLEKGSRRDAYVLVITINETRPFFYNLDVTAYTANNDPFNVLSDNESVSGAGYRWFVGRRGMIHVAGGAEQEYSSASAKRASTAEVGYTQYGLFGRDVFASISVATPTEDHLDKVTFLPQLTLGLPLSRTQTLTTSFTTSDIERHFDTYRRKALRLEWSHNTTNDPFFPTRGTLVAVGPLFAADDAYYSRYNPQTRQTEALHDKTHTIGLSVVAAHHWEISERDSISARGEADLRHTNGDRNGAELDDSYTPGSLRVSWSRSLWSRERVAVDGDMRLEGALRFTSGPHEIFFEDTHTTFASVDWVRRTSWGAMRIGLGYAW